MKALWWRTALALGAFATSACTTAEFLVQAAQGQWGLLSEARPLDVARRDPSYSPRTHALLAEIPRIKEFGRARGLSMHANYETFVELGRQYVVWFVNASAPLAFEPRTYTFPLVGSFPGLSWFSEERAREFAAELSAAGWDVNVRGVTAFSTGGWFDDPVLSSMFVDHPAQTGLLVNVLLHESLHATVLVQNEQYFNESLASFVADTLTPEYLVAYYGSASREFWEYQRAVNDARKREKVLGLAFERLRQTYEDESVDDAVKAAYKAHVMSFIEQSVYNENPPNNATLIGFQLYHQGDAEFSQLLAACSYDWPRFLASFGGLSRGHFGAPQTPEIGAVVARIAQNGCLPLPAQLPPRSLTPQYRRRVGAP